MSKTSLGIIKAAKIMDIKSHNESVYNHHKRNGGEFREEKFSIFLKKEVTNIDGYSAITLSNRNCSKYHVLFLHGGSFIEEPILFHRFFIERLVSVHKFKCTVFNYPLSPENKAEYIIETVVKFYKTMVNSSDDKFILMGDSSGAGLALSILELIRDNNETMPYKTVLISPWLDITVSNPLIKKYERKDSFLSVDTLKKAGKRYRGNIKEDDPRVSPINGNLNNLGNIIIYVGTHEIFFPDCVKINEKIKDCVNTKANLIIGNDLFHDYVITPLKESDIALKNLMNSIIEEEKL